MATLSMGAQKKNNTVLDVKESITDNSIVYPESFETDTRKLLEGWYMKNYTATDSRYATTADPNVSDAVIIKRLKEMPTVIEMPFNQIVRQYIDRYTKKGRAQVAATLGLSLYYLPIFEQALEEQGLPLELKYLPMIESGLDPNAVSRHGATGLWQFMLPAAKGLGMEVNSLVDERRDPYLSSEKAAGFLKDLYQAYGDWSLAIAAYNCGPGIVNKAIRRAGGDPASHDFWSIYNYLPAETRGYVPMFIAANYVMTYYPEHKISPVLPTKPLVTDTINISDRVHFDQISAVLNIPLDELRLLNPQFRADIIPGTPDHQYALILPAQQVHAYLLSEDAIKNYQADKYSRRAIVELAGTSTPAADALADNPRSDINTETNQGNDEINEVRATAASRQQLKSITHKVAAGETLASIAHTYGVSIADIKRWNSLSRNTVRTGRQLRIVTADTSAQTPASTASSATAAAVDPAPAQPQQQHQPAPKQQTSRQEKKKQAAPRTSNHNIANGETLSSIAKKYGVSVADLKKANGLSNDNIRAGKTLKIPAGKGSQKSGSKSSSKRRRRR